MFLLQQVNPYIKLSPVLFNLIKTFVQTGWGLEHFLISYRQLRLCELFTVRRLLGFSSGCRRCFSFLSWTCRRLQRRDRTSFTGAGQTPWFYSRASSSSYLAGSSSLGLLRRTGGFSRSFSCWSCFSCRLLLHGSTSSCCLLPSRKLHFISRLLNLLFMNGPWLAVYLKIKHEPVLRPLGSLPYLL